MIRLCRGVFSIVSLTALAACVGTAPTASKAEQQAADEAFYKCVETNANAMDDGRSDASTVAAVVRSACKEQYGRSLAVAARGLSPAAQQSVFRDMRNADLEYAVKTVLRLRQQKRITRS